MRLRAILLGAALAAAPMWAHAVPTAADNFNLSSAVGSLPFFVFDDSGNALSGATGTLTATNDTGSDLSLGILGYLEASEVSNFSATFGGQSIFSEDTWTSFTNKTVNIWNVIVPKGETADLVVSHDGFDKGYSYYFDIVSLQAVPLPLAAPLAIAGFGLMALVSRRRRAA